MAQEVGSSRSAPTLRAGLLVQRDDEGRAFVVPGDDDRVAVEGRGAPFAEAPAGLHLAQVLLPDQLPVHVQAIDAAGAEVGDDALAVRDGRVRGGAGLGPAGLVRGRFAQRLLPDRLAGPAIQREQHVLVDANRLRGRRSRGGGRTGRRRFRRLRLGEAIRWNRRLNVHALAPHDRRGVPAAGNRDFPANVLGLAPFRRRIAARCGARGHPGRAAGANTPPAPPDETWAMELAASPHAHTIAISVCLIRSSFRLARTLSPRSDHIRQRHVGQRAVASPRCRSSWDSRIRRRGVLRRAGFLARGRR